MRRIRVGTVMLLVVIAALLIAFGIQQYRLAELESEVRSIRANPPPNQVGSILANPPPKRVVELESEVRSIRANPPPNQTTVSPLPPAGAPLR